MKKILRLVAGDFRNVRRDSLLILSLIGPVIIAIVIRCLVPVVTALILNYSSFNLEDHYNFIISFALLLTPMILGSLAGFLVLDERDQGILTYLSITPLSKTFYLFYRIITPVTISFIFSFFILTFNGLIEVNLIRQIPVMVMASLEAPIIALIIVSFASNKVEGLAISKITGIILLAPLVRYFISSKLRFLAGFFPPFWVAEAFLAASRGWVFLLYIIVGLGIHLVFVYLLLKKFIYKIEK